MTSLDCLHTGTCSKKSAVENLWALRVKDANPNATNPKPFGLNQIYPLIATGLKPQNLLSINFYTSLCIPQIPIHSMCPYIPTYPSINPTKPQRPEAIRPPPLQARCGQQRSPSGAPGSKERESGDLGMQGFRFWALGFGGLGGLGGRSGLEFNFSWLEPMEDLMETGKERTTRLPCSGLVGKEGM